jgi:uncharacterized protein (TIGR03067 family)
MKMTIKMALAVTILSILMPWGLVCTQATGTTNLVATELQRLQGSWEGVLVGQEAAGKVSITITGNSLHFQGLSPDEWYETTFTLPAGTDPQQLHATIKDCPEPDDIGKVVFAIFKIEDGTLTLAGIQASAAKPPKTFGEDQGNSIFHYDPKNLGKDQAFENNSIFRYDLKKVQPQKKVAQPPKSK